MARPPRGNRLPWDVQSPDRGGGLADDVTETSIEHELQPAYYRGEYFDWSRELVDEPHLLNNIHTRRESMPCRSRRVHYRGDVF